MLTPRARSLFPSWVDISAQPASLRALAVFAAQNPGLEFGNYGHLPSYRADARRITKDLQRCRDAMHSCCGRGITDAQVIEAARHTFAGRLTIRDVTPARNPQTAYGRGDSSCQAWVDNDAPAPRAFAIDYTTGQYWPTEYRAAVAAVLEQVSREAYARASEPQAA